MLLYISTEIFAKKKKKKKLKTFMKLLIYRGKVDNK